MAKEGTYVAREILTADSKMQANLACKRVLASKTILAWILRRLVEPYCDYTPEEIVENFIDDASIQLFTEVAPGLTNREEIADTENTESLVPGEATVFFDVLFTAKLPKEFQSKFQICLKIDVEAQKEYRPGYPLEKRGIYYIARMVSSQITNVNHGKSYAKLQKVYGIWICLGKDIPKSDQQSITRFYIEKEDIVGNAYVRKEDYDLMEMYMVRLGDGETDDEFLGMMQTLFHENLSVKERMDKLESQYGIPMTREFEEGIEDMCTYADFIEERGIDKGLAKGAKALIETCRELGLTRDIICLKVQEKLEISEEEAENYLEKFWK